MALDPEVLLNYPISEVRQRYNRCDNAFHALTLGLGGDPPDERQLVYVDPCCDLQALPYMALILGHPDFRLGNLATGVDALHLVHDKQRLGWRRPLPAEGEVTGQTRVTGLVDKGAGKDALLYNKKVLSDALNDEALAVARNTTFLRGNGDFGGSRQMPEMSRRLFEQTPDLRPDPPTRPEQALYYRPNNGDNPLRAEPAAAPQAGSPQPILHGLCTLGVIFHTVLRGLADYHAEQLRHLQVRFSAPVSPGETLHTEMWSDSSFRTRVAERDVVVLDNGRVGPLPERPS